MTTVESTQPQSTINDEKDATIAQLQEKIKQLEITQQTLLEELKKTEYLRETRPRKNPRINDGPLIQTYQKGILTLDALFEDTVKKHANVNCMGWRPIVNIKTEEKEINGTKKTWETYEMGEMKWLTYKQIGEKVDALSSGLVQFANLKKGDIICLYENTRPEVSNDIKLDNLLITKVDANSFCLLQTWNHSCYLLCKLG